MRACYRMSKQVGSRQSTAAATPHQHTTPTCCLCRRDVAIAITKNGKPVKGLCPGDSYDVSIAFPQPRAALVTVSQGTLAESNVPRWCGKDAAR